MGTRDNDNPYWEAAKYAFAIAGGAAVASTLVAAGYKLLKKGADSIKENRPAPIEEEESTETEEVKAEEPVEPSESVKDTEESEPEQG